MLRDGGSHVPDIAVRHIDDAMVERIKQIARERNWSINDVILHALRSGLGMGGETLGEEREFRSIANLTGTWHADETAALEEAIDAMASVPEGQLARKPGDGKPKGRK
jgi:hypothetical protein